MINVSASAHRLLGAVSIGSMTVIAMAASTPAAAQSERALDINVPAMPLGQALNEIARLSGARIDFDPDAVRTATSRPVHHAKSARDAVAAATTGLNLAVEASSDGIIGVYQGIVVTARRDEAETNALVRQASTSDRSGLSLREQPRNNQVISAKTIQDQQALSISEVLRNAGAVSTISNSPGGGSTYSVRGFSSGGLVNGLSSSGNFGVSSGANQPIASIERVEILKGPDALLVGFDNLGGNVNVVTKKPDAEERLIMSMDVGSYGLVRGVLDANQAVTADKSVTARLIASAQTMDRNYGGYTGNKDYLLAPSIRFKDGRTDIILGLSASDSTSGITPFTLFDPNTGQIVKRDLGTPIFSSDQSIKTKTTRVYADLTRELTRDITFVVRGLHDDNRLGLDVYPFYLNSAGIPTVAVRGSGQVGKSDAADAFFRIRFKPANFVTVRLNVGYNFSQGSFEPRSSASYDIIQPVPLGANTTIPVPPRPAATDRSFRLGSQQQGVFGQALLDFGRVKLLGGLRRNWYKSTFEFFGFGVFPPDRDAATVPNFGAVVDVTDNISVFANYVKGLSASTSTNFAGSRLPNINSRNKEAGIKVDLWNHRATINASYFDLLQDNTLVNDPTHPGFSIPGPGQRGRGVDLNIVGQLMQNWTVQASYTRTKYAFLSPSDFQTVIPNQPRDKYSIYSNYRTQITPAISGGFGAGLFGRSSSYAEYFGEFVVPEARQVDVNGFLTIAGFEFNVGVRNVFNRRNYGTTRASDFVPVDEPRNVRLTVTKQVF